MLMDGGFTPPRYASMREMEQALAEIRTELGGSDIISTDPEDLHAHGYSEWSTVNPEGLPVAVAYPRSTEQVSTIARVCHKYRIPIIPYSGGSSLEGNFSAPFGGISVDFAYMDKIVQFNKDDMDVVVQPSIGWQDLNEQLVKMGSGLFFPIDPGPSAKVGGMIGTNCSGTNAVKYGTMKDWVINLTVVLADGTVIKTRRRPRKSSAGYNLNGLFVGSEGTLGLVTEATLKLTVIPEEFSVAVVTFPSIRDAASAAAGVMQTGIPVAAMEIMDEVQMKVVNMGGATAPRVWKEMPTLFFKFSGTKAGVKENISLVQRITKANNGSNFEFAKDAREQKLLWSARKESLWSMLALRKDGEEVWSTDVAVPFSRLADIIEVSKKEMDDLGLFASILGHIGDGNFHESIIYNRRDKGEREKVEACVKNMVKRALEMEGTCTGEHSIGYGKKESLLWEVGPDTLGVMKAIKSALDPHWIMFVPLNPVTMEWRTRRSATIILRDVKPNTTTHDIYQSLESYGQIARVEIDERRPIRTANVIFEPPPHNVSFFVHGQCKIQGDRPYWAWVGFLHQAGAEQDIRTPIGNLCPQVTTLDLSSIAFGFLLEPTVFMSKSVVTAPTGKTPLNLSIDFKGTTFIVNFWARAALSGPALDVRKYKLDINFDNVKRMYRVGSGARTGLIMVLNHPPKVSRMRGDLTRTFQENRLVWDKRDMWMRCTEVSRLSDRALGALSLQDNHQIIDFGRWTTYWFNVDENLRDWNLELLDGTFTRTADSDADLWTLLDRPEVPAAAEEDLLSLGEIAPAPLPFDVRYQLEVCISHGVLNEHNIGEPFIKKLTELAEIKVLEYNRARLLLEYAADQGKRIYDPMELFRDQSALEYIPSTARLPDHCALVRKATITPTKLYFNTPTVETTNRVIRQYKPVQDNFLRIQFADETGKIRGCEDDRDDRIYVRAFRVLTKGIKMGNVEWKFLAFGNSQIRESGAYFFCETEDVTCESIRKWMGRFGHIKIVAKYAARLGQCFSTTRPVPKTITPRIVKIEDVEKGNYCFTDGVGKISPLLASMVAQDWNISLAPSAFQFRMGGCKGVLVTWPGIPGVEVHIRKSQEKFLAEFNGLEIIRCSQYSSATLNRQTITILSCLGVPAQVFVDMMNEQLANYDRAMKDPSKAADLLSRYVDENHMTKTIEEMILNGFMDSQEPFVRILVRLWRSWSIKALKEKARLIVDKGAFVLGGVDETGTLRGYRSPTSDRAGRIGADSLPEIFLQVPDPDDKKQYKAITGICIVGRNPSLHPGDIRVVNAVDSPELRHIRDVVIFPQGGDRDIPSMCSGGDLDGDDFFVIWDERLLPKEWSHPPMDYTPQQPLVEKNDVAADALKQFFVLYMKYNNLGLVAHAHLAAADSEDQGAKSSKCLNLAKLHSHAVDYAKTGKPAKWERKLEPRQWPHFMEKKRRSSYHSTTALGQLYDMVQSPVFDVKDDYEKPFDQRILNRYKLPNGILKKARRLKTQYDIAMRRVMAQLEVGSEFELWTGFVMSKPRYGSDYKVQEKVGQESYTLKKLFRDLCIKDAGVAGGTHDIENFGPFVAAMYRVTLEEVRIALHEARQPHVMPDGNVARRRISTRSMPLISFPWLFDGVLGEIAGEVTSDDADLDADEESMSYTRMNDGQLIHRGEILHLFHHDDDDDEDEYWGGDEASEPKAPQPPEGLEPDELAAEIDLIDLAEPETETLHHKAVPDASGGYLGDLAQLMNVSNSELSGTETHGELSSDCFEDFGTATVTSADQTNDEVNVEIEGVTQEAPWERLLRAAASDK
ncbi:RNA dependent RNA polymerase-domain-containing protein [Podospora aff. communis PSN243]|uniref:RNA dependent RNA polymerase-domain-containing protein n=1 Tax=Podospora aff. communis PSN243 TaxID=3040156 RepID=A0AAV9GWU5_9PEZI|nr:RNA dependent RNA polymerase-domain-containing protein [Podospora aff. communis PSN243]